jgi:molybdate transport system substrate-binding protein
MKRLPAIIVMLAVAIGLIVLVWPRNETSTGTPENRPLVCYVGGTMTPVFNELAAAYKEETGAVVDITSADSGELLATIEMQLQGDLYVAHDPFMYRVMERGVGVSAWHTGNLYPVMVVAKGNPKNIGSLPNLMRPDVKVYLTDYSHSTLGNMLPVIFNRAGIDFDRFNESKEILTHRSGSWVANQVIMRSADAALVWQVVAQLRSENLDLVRIDEYLPRPGIDGTTSASGKRYGLMPVKVTVITLSCSKRPHESAEFVDFVRSEAGKEIFRKHHFEVDEHYGTCHYLNGVQQEVNY